METDDETRARMVRYCGGDPHIPRTVCDEVLSEYPKSWALPDFLALIAEAVARIPEEARATAVVALEGGYEESTLLKIFYSRPETEEEVAANVADALQYARAEMRKEREQYEKLKRKFGL